MTRYIDTIHTVHLDFSGIFTPFGRQCILNFTENQNLFLKILQDTRHESHFSYIEQFKKIQVLIIENANQGYINDVFNALKNHDLLGHIEYIDLSNNDLSEVPKIFTSAYKPSEFSEQDKWYSSVYKNHQSRLRDLEEELALVNNRINRASPYFFPFVLAKNVFFEIPRYYITSIFFKFQESILSWWFKIRKTDFPNLDQLILKENRIEIIPDNCFSNAPDLKNLVLSRNKIIKLSVNSFLGLTCLDTLDLSHNKLGLSPNEPRDIFGQVFSSSILPKLEELTLDFNHLRMDSAVDAFHNFICFLSGSVETLSLMRNEMMFQFENNKIRNINVCTDHSFTIKNGKFLQTYPTSEGEEWHIEEYQPHSEDDLYYSTLFDRIVYILTHKEDEHDYCSFRDTKEYLITYLTKKFEEKFEKIRHTNEISLENEYDLRQLSQEEINLENEKKTTNSEQRLNQIKVHLELLRKLKAEMQLIKGSATTILNRWKQEAELCKSTITTLETREKKLYEKTISTAAFIVNKKGSEANKSLLDLANTFGIIRGMIDIPKPGDKKVNANPPAPSQNRNNGSRNNGGP